MKSIPEGQSLEGWNLPPRVLKISETIQTTERNIMNTSRTSTTSFENEAQILADLFVLVPKSELIKKIVSEHASSCVLAYHYVADRIPLTDYIKADIEYGFESFITKVLGFEPYWEGDPWPTNFQNLAEVFAREAELEAEEEERGE